LNLLFRIICEKRWDGNRKSHFEGISFTPEGLEDVAMFKNLVYELLKEGFTEEQIKKILGENFLRVFKKADEAYWKNNAF